MKTLEQYQKDIPPDILKKHNAMSVKEAQAAADDLRLEEMKCEYFGNDCPVRGPDGFLQASQNFGQRADYFELLAKSKSKHAISP